MLSCTEIVHEDETLGSLHHIHNAQINISSLLKILHFVFLIIPHGADMSTFCAIILEPKMTSHYLINGKYCGNFWS